MNQRRCPGCGDSNHKVTRPPDGYFGNWRRCEFCGKVFRS